MGKRRRRSRYRFDEIPTASFRSKRLEIPSNSANACPKNHLREDVAVREQTARDVSAHREEDLHTFSDNGEIDNEAGEYTPRDFEALSQAHLENHSSSLSSDGSLLAGKTDKNVQIYFPTPVKNWRVLWALLRTSGTKRFTKEQYQSVRFLSESLVKDGIVDWRDKPPFSESEEAEIRRTSYLPHYSTLYRTVKPELYRILTARSFVHFETVNMRKAGAKSTKMSGVGGHAVALKTVLPSEYARLDIATPDVFYAMQRTSLEYHEKQGIQCTIPRLCSLDCVDIIPLVAARRWFYGRTQAIHIDRVEPDVSPTYFAEVGDVVRVSVITKDKLQESFERCFFAGKETMAYPAVQGKVLYVWTVRHFARKGEIDADPSDSSSLSSRDRDIQNMFNCLEYSSPTDAISVVVPDLPSEDESEELRDMESIRARKEKMNERKRLRRIALKERKRQLEAAVRNWRKAIIKPGDVVALLCPSHDEVRESGRNTLLTNTDKQSRVLLVNRHWTEEDERSSHILWITGGSDLDAVGQNLHRKRPDDSLQFCESPFARSSSYHIHVKEVVLVHAHSGQRGPHKHSAVSSFGTLVTGELYIVYRFVLFWDGFNVLDGKEATGDGIYLMCLNLPSNFSRTPNDIRIISLTPPGVKSDTVLRAITQDITEGMTDGFLDIDAEGNKRRIFLDLVGFIGDTPALNSFLDVLGHNAIACCHLCRYVRQSSTMVGSRFTARPLDGTRTAFQRSFMGKKLCGIATQDQRRAVCSVSSMIQTFHALCSSTFGRGYWKWDLAFRKRIKGIP